MLQDILQTDCVLLSGDNNYFLVQLGNVEERHHPTSNQEEADVDIFVYLRSPFCDTNILVLALGIFRDHKERVFYDYGDDHRKRSILLSSLEMDENRRDSLLFFTPLLPLTIHQPSLEKVKRGSGPLGNEMIASYKLLMFLKVTGILTKTWNVFCKDTFVLFTEKRNYL